MKKNLLTFSLVGILFLANFAVAQENTISESAWPQYEDNKIKKQIHRVMVDGAALRTTISTCIYEGSLNLGVVSMEKVNNCDPGLVESKLVEGDTYGDPAFTEPSYGTGYPQIIMRENETVFISSKFGNDADPILIDEGLILQWSLNKTKWSCFVGSSTQENSLALRDQGNRLTLLRPSNYSELIQYMPRGCTLVDKQKSPYE